MCTVILLFFTKLVITVVNYADLPACMESRGLLHDHEVHEFSQTLHLSFLCNPIIIIIIIIIINVVSCLKPFLPGTSLEPGVITTAQASSVTQQYFP
jgi:hypothetical protein